MAGGSRLEWHGDAAEAHVNKRAAGVIKKICVLIKNTAKRLLSVAGTGKTKGKTTGPVTRSAPGEPPRKQTGHLRREVMDEVDAASLTGRVGTNVPYGKHLELGTKRGLKARPWLRPAYLQCGPLIAAYLASLNSKE